MAAPSFDWTPYWTRIWYAADANRRSDVFWTLCRSASITGVLALAGTAVIPGLGTLTGGFLGLLLSAVNAYATSCWLRNRTYWQVLEMNAAEGITR